MVIADLFAGGFGRGLLGSLGLLQQRELFLEGIGSFIRETERSGQFSETGGNGAGYAALSARL
ncbi:hypothetical protein D3C76_1007770 [compost metagenome]